MNNRKKDFSNAMIKYLNRLPVFVGPLPAI